MLDTVRPSLAGFFEGTNPTPPTHLGTRYDTAGNFLLETVNRHFRENWWKMTPPTTTIALARLGNDAGIIGAAGVARDARERDALPPIGK